ADCDDRLLLSEAADRVIHSLAAGGGSTRTVDVEDYRLDPIGLTDLVEKVLHLLIVGDDAAHLHAGDVGQETAGASHILATRHQQCDEQHGEDDCREPPHGKLPPKAAAFDHSFGFDQLQSLSK